MNFASTLEIYLLGGFQVKVGGVVLENTSWKRRSAIKLVKLLALAPAHRIHREQLMEILWAEQYSENLTNNLNKTIHEARRALEPLLKKASDSRFIRSASQQIFLTSPDAIFVDAAEFEQTAERGIKTGNLADCESALKLYRGDLLLEDIYEDWTASRREQLRFLHRALVAKTSAIYAGQTRYERSIELLKKLSLTDPTDERVHQDLMRLYALTGSKYQALKQFEICRRMLAEIGFAPEPQTLALKAEIQSGRIAPVKASPAAVKTDGAPPTDGGAPIHDAAGGIAAPAPRVKCLTFNHGVVQYARFLSNGEDILFGAAWEENDFEIYQISRESLAAEPTGITKSGILSVSPAAEIALSLNRRFVRGYNSAGTLAFAKLPVGEIDELLDDIEWADWHPQKSVEKSAAAAERIALVRHVNGRSQLEYPIGNVVFETGGWISHPRFSPGGDRLALINHPTPDDDSGEIVAVDLQGAKSVLSRNWISLQGLVWHESTGEIWFTGTREGNSRAIHAVDLEGTERLIYKGTGSITLHDLAADGTALITYNKTQIKISARLAGDAKERDLTWHDWSLVRDIAPDGSVILFTEAGESGGTLYAAYTRRIDGSETKRLGEGSALALAPGGDSALVKLGTSPPQLAIYEINSGERKLLKQAESKSIFYQPWASWFPDGKKILFTANEADAGTKLYTQDFEAGAAAVCLTPFAEGFELSTPHAVSPDGTRALVIHPDKRIYLLTLSNGKLAPLGDLEANLLAVGWSADGRQIFFRERGRVPAIVFSYDLESGRRAQIFELQPPYRTGVFEILRVLVTPARNAYAYSYTREFSDLMIIEGLR